MPEKYNSSKIENQQKFEQLPLEEKEAVIGDAQKIAFSINKSIDNPIDFFSKTSTSSGCVDPENEYFILDKLNVPNFILENSDISSVVKKNITNDILIGLYGTYSSRFVNLYIEKMRLPNEFMLSTIKEVMYALLKGSHGRGIAEGIREVASNIEVLQEIYPELLSEFSPILKQKILFFLLHGEVNDAIFVMERLSMSPSIENLTQIPECKSFFNIIEEKLPEFYNQMLKSFDIVISILKFINNPEQFIQEIQENPFLLNAVSENPRFGSKLLIKYPQFDELSKENIETLFGAKKEISANNPDIDPESLEFRQLMQGKLKEYKNNPEILEAMQESGINIDEWLNYSETKYFNLEAGDSHLAFSETIQAPINRIKETLDSYTYTLKNVLKEYKSELSEFKIPLEDAKEIEGKIAQMQTELEKAKAEGNDKKAQGIEKGIEGLKNKIENIKTVALWDKLLGDISAFQQLKNDVFSVQEKLMQSENDLQEKLSGKMPSGKMIQELKEKINKAKEELRRKFGALETRIENFKTNLLPLIAPALSNERSEALIQEIEQNLAEQFDHWNTDRRDLANLFSERGDREKGKLENQQMSIFVWARNPDVDLYQGNYSPCCICIDSAHMGAESTIADYNTDLVIQIVNIWDETKNEPVTAAWCWLGQDENGEIALVVDNIESNVSYSANYSEQLTKELFDYLENYARTIGAKKIVLGKANNDLPTAGELAKLKDDEYEYDKVGGYNRVDGYFLEAEDRSVKVI